MSIGRLRMLKASTASSRSVSLTGSRSCTPPILSRSCSPSLDNARSYHLQSADELLSSIIAREGSTSGIRGDGNAQGRADDARDNRIEAHVDLPPKKASTRGTKPRASGQRKGRLPDKQQETLNGARITKPVRKSIPKKADEEPLGLEAALPRRLDWTPPKPSPVVAIDLTGDSPEPTDGDYDLVRKQLGSMLTSFECGTGTADAVKTARQDGLGKLPPLKRRKLDIVGIAGNRVKAATPTVSEKANAKKAAKKKAQTITALATEAFQPSHENEKPSLMEEFLSQVQADSRFSGLEADADGLSGVVEKTKANRGAKAKRNSKKAAVESNLLQPRQAIEAVGDHDFLFGTSSQLVREESPTFIRDLQSALKASEASEASTSKTGSSMVLGSRTGSSLWEAATRDLEGSLLEAETVDLTAAPKAIHAHSISLAGSFQPTRPLLAPQRPPPVPVTAPTSPAKTDTSFLVATATAQRPPPMAVDPQDGPHFDLPKSIAEAACRPRSRSPEKKEEKSRAKVPKVKQTPTATGPVDYSTWTVAQLSKQIKSYGFKAVKGKSAMIALLERCDASTNRPILQPVEVNTSAPAPHAAMTGNTSTKPKAKPARKSKAAQTASKSTQPEAEAAVSKKRGRPRKAEASPAENEAPAATPSTASRNAGVETTAPTHPPSDKHGNSTLQALPSSILVTSSPPSAATPTPLLPLHSAVPAPDATKQGAAAPKRRRTPAAPPPPPPLLHEAAPLSIPPAEHCVTAGADGGAEDALARDPNAALLDAITRAVTTWPPSNDPKMPTWYEKMLMYDPVVLEDLAVWLNTDGLDRVGCDEEVWPALVRQWCEERSVCCLWRENLRGGSRSRY